jgi:PA14 domain/Chaperone of endosialidase
LKASPDTWSTLNTDLSGNLVLKSMNENIKIGTRNNLTITSHDGATTGLILGNTLVTANGFQINYTRVSPGVATAERALVLDVNKDIVGIRNVSASTIFGTLQTTFQPLIQRVNTLNISNHNGSTTGLSLAGTIVTASAERLNYIDVSPGTAQANKALVVDTTKSITGLELIAATNLTGVLLTARQPNINSVNRLTISDHNGSVGLVLGSTLVTATGEQINRLNVEPGLVSPNKAIVAGGASDVIGVNNLVANNLTGVIQTSVQPNINTVDVLNIVNHDGLLSGLSLNGVLVKSTAVQLNRLAIDAGIAMAGKALVLSQTMNITGINILNANTLGGVLSNPSQPNITSVRELDIVAHDADTIGLSLGGHLVTSSANQLNYCDVRPGFALASKAIVLDSDYSIIDINSLTANKLTGVIQTTYQPNLSRVNTLNILQHDGATGLSLNGVLITATAAQINLIAVNPGYATAEKALVLDSAKNVAGVNRILATQLGGVLLTPNQPNITSVNTLNISNHNSSTTGLSLNGTVITASGTQINRIDTTAGSAVAGKVLIVDNALNIGGINILTATQLIGSVETANQPHINSVKVLNIADHNGGSAGLSLGGGLVSATAEQLNYTIVAPGSATSQRALVTDQYNSVGGINNLTATKLIAQRLSLTSVISNYNTGGVVIKTYSFTDLVGRMVDIQLLPTFSFTNFNPSGLSSGFSCEMVGYLRPAFSETYTFYANSSDRVRVWVNGNLILHSWTYSNTIRGSSTIFLNADQWVPIYVQYQVDVGNSPSFALEWSSTSTTRSTIPGAFMAWDNNAPATSSKHFSRDEFTIYNTTTASANTARFTVDTGGDLTIDASGNDILFGIADSVNIQSHNGTSSGLYLGGVLVQPTAYELNALKVSPGLASASHAIVLDASNSVTGINSMSATSISCNSLTTNAFTISNLSLSGPLNNYNTGSLLIRQITGPNVSGRVVNVDVISDLNLNNYDPKGLNINYSLDIIGYVLPAYTDVYNFHVIANDRARIWVNNVLIFNQWNASTGVEYTSLPISLTAGQWTPIYIQFQNVIDSALLQIRWSAPALVKSFITSASMAWDNTFALPTRATSCADQLTVFSSAAGLTSIQSGHIAIDGVGNMSMNSTSGNIVIVDGCNLNIAGHNAATVGLKLAGGLVRSTAIELNYLSGSSPGTALASKAIVLGPDKSLVGLQSIEGVRIVGTIETPAQPLITSIGTLTSTLNSLSDVVITSTNKLRFAADGTACYIQSGSSSGADSAADLFIGNYLTTQASSSRKIMIKASGYVGIQTTTPNRTLSINGAGSSYCMRLINNAALGEETTYCDIGVDSSSTLRIGSNISIGPVGQTGSIAVAAGVMKLSSTGGSIQIGNTSNATLPLEIGSTPFTISSVVGYINSSGSTGVVIPTSTAYSLRTTSSIIVNGTVCITSDRRLKKCIKPLDYDQCKRFIIDSEPVKFIYADDASASHHCGLIAQHVAKSPFPQLVNVSPCPGIEESIDGDGWVSPKDASLNVAYDEIIPILMTVVRQTTLENESLRKEVAELKTRMDDIISRLNATPA